MVSISLSFLSSFPCSLCGLVWSGGLFLSALTSHTQELLDGGAES